MITAVQDLQDTSKVSVSRMDDRIAAQLSVHAVGWKEPRFGSFQKSSSSCAPTTGSTSVPSLLILTSRFPLNALRRCLVRWKGSF